MGEGPALYILHGLFGSGDNWQTHAKSFASKFRVHLVDLRNHGRSPHSPEMNFDVMAADLFDLVAQNGDRDINLLGHSMGGKAVMRFAQLYAMLVHKMVVADIGIKPYPPHHELVFEGINSVDLEKISSRKEVEEQLAQHIPDNTTVQFLLKSLYWQQPGKLAWRFNAQALASNIHDILVPIEGEQINADTLFIRGGKSKYIEESDESDIRKLLPHSKFITIPGAGHWVHADAPAAFGDAVLDFLST
jgi:pimeloyl-ACP methyl ester carboxylesterase